MPCLRHTHLLDAHKGAPYLVQHQGSRAVCFHWVFFVVLGLHYLS